MNFISIYGQLLSEKTKLKLMPCKGLIRLAFNDANIDPDSAKYEDYKMVFNQYLKERLERSGIDNADEIVKSMISELVNNQAVFIMGS